MFGSDLDYLTDADRALIHAATGETIKPGQEPHERPLSAFAMQLAVDRRAGLLPRGAAPSADYLRRRRDALDELQVPANPFTGSTLQRALAFVAAQSPHPHAP